LENIKPLKLFEVICHVCQVYYRQNCSGNFLRVLEITTHMICGRCKLRILFFCVCLAMIPTRSMHTRAKGVVIGVVCVSTMVICVVMRLALKHSTLAHKCKIFHIFHSSLPHSRFLASSSIFVYFLDIPHNYSYVKTFMQ